MACRTRKYVADEKTSCKFRNQPRTNLKRIFNLKKKEESLSRIEYNGKQTISEQIMF